MSSTTFTVPKGVKKIDAFCVGGGGAVPYILINYSDGSWKLEGGGGGGGGYTTTKLGVDVNPGQQLSVVVGAGGKRPYPKSCNAGGKSSVGDICSANGGNSGVGVCECTIGSVSWAQAGSDGGSGGAQGYYCSSYFTIYKGGTDGGDGSSWKPEDSKFPAPGGKGQGTTTRYFGESNGTLYSTGGSCIPYNKDRFSSEIDSVSSSLPANTGNGGNKVFQQSLMQGGSSGICIIRWGKR